MNDNTDFEREAHALLNDMRAANDDFEKEVPELSIEIDKKLAATDAALETATTELERSDADSDITENTEL